MRRIPFQFSEELSQWDHEIGELVALIKQQANADERIKRLLESTVWIQSAHRSEKRSAPGGLRGGLGPGPFRRMRRFNNVTGTELHTPFKCPINRIYTRFDKPRKRRIHPVTHSRDMPMFHGIEMNVVDMTGIIQAVANRRFPLSSLPDAPFAFGDAHGR